MADHADDGDDDDVFVYMGGHQEVPRGVRYVRIHKSVKIIPARAFQNCTYLVSIEMHDGVKIIEEHAFYGCISFIGIKLSGVRVIGQYAFHGCTALEYVEFGDRLETIGNRAFGHCHALRTIKIPKVSNIGFHAFANCKELNKVELSKDLERIEPGAFTSCRELRCIAMPLKENLLGVRLGEHVFDDCPHLSRVNLVGGIHKTVSSLLLESWRDEMNDEIDRINRSIPYIMMGKTAVVIRWMDRVIERTSHYKSEQYDLLKKATTLLELALWKTELEKTAKEEDAEEGHSLDEKQPAKKAKICEHGETAASTKALHADEEAKIAIHADRQQARVTCGANIIIPHVLSFLNNAAVFPLLNQNA